MPLSDEQFEQLKTDINEILQLRVKPANGSYDELGKRVFDWATKPESRPALNLDGSVKDVEAFKNDIGVLFQNLPENIERIIFVQPQAGEYYIRLPAQELVKKSFSIMERLPDLSEEQKQLLNFNYPDPGFYEDRIAGQTMTELEYLKNRVGDYTFAHCA